MSKGPGQPHSRRRFLLQTSRVLALCAAGAVGYSFLLEPRWFAVTRREIYIRDLHDDLAGLRIVHLTDIHHGPWLSLNYVRQVIDAANALEPDLICLTGDYVHHSAAYIDPVVQEFARLRASVGVVAVLGNHDRWEGVEAMRGRVFRDAGIPLLDNRRLVLTPQRRLAGTAEEGLAVCGVGDLWEDLPDYRLALAGLPAAMPRLLLSHNPDVAEERGLIQSGYRVDLMLSGHTHGGQVVLPLLGPPVTSSRCGQKLRQGLVEGPVCPVFISRGIGVSGFPVRLGRRPEMAVLTLRACPEE